MIKILHQKSVNCQEHPRSDISCQFFYEFHSKTGVSCSNNSKSIDRLRGLRCHKTNLKCLKHRKVGAGWKSNAGEKHNWPADIALNK